MVAETRQTDLPSPRRTESSSVASISHPDLEWRETVRGALKDTHPNDTLTVVLPEYMPSHWWEHLLHNHTALRLKAALLFHPGIVVANVPYHMAN